MFNFPPLTYPPKWNQEQASDGESSKNDNLLYLRTIKEERMGLDEYSDQSSWLAPLHQHEQLMEAVANM